jgi:hypothetical protein
MARHMLVAVAVLALGAVTVPAGAQTQPGPTVLREGIEAMPHDQALRYRGETLGKSVEATQSDPSIPDILQALDLNIEATRRIRGMVDGSEALGDEQIAEIAGEIANIARSFRAVAELAPGVFERRWQELSSIEAIGAAIGFRIAGANARLTELRTENESIDRYLRESTLTRAQIEMLRLTRTANEAEAHSIEAAIAAWNYFSERQADVVARLGDQSEDLGVFFHALRENARVYEAAAQTLGIANSLKLALRDLSTIEHLESLRSEIVRSWDDLMKIVDEVSNGLMLQPGM